MTDAQHSPDATPKPKRKVGRPKGTGGIRSRSVLAREGELNELALTPLQYAIQILNNPNEPSRRKEWAAQLAAPYVHRKQPMAVEQRDITHEEEVANAATVREIESVLAAKQRASRVAQPTKASPTIASPTDQSADERTASPSVVPTASVDEHPTRQ